MKEALGMYGSELTYAGNCFTAGYVIGQLPAVILATKVRPSILIPTLEILWSILTFCSSTLKTSSQLYALRFLVGLCEGGYFPVMIVRESHTFCCHPLHKPYTVRKFADLSSRHSTSSRVGIPRRSVANASACSTALLLLQACFRATCKQARTVV